MPPMNYSTPNPWMSMDDIAELYRQGPNASFDPSVQENLNAQSMVPNLSGEQMDHPEMKSAPNLGGSGMAAPKGADLSGMNAAIAAFNEKNVQGMGLQKDEIEKLKAYRDAMPQGPAGMDLTGLAQWADFANPNNGKLFTSTYKAPETGAEREAKKAQVTEALAKLGGSLSKDELQILKDRMTGEGLKLHYGQAKEAMNSQKASDNEEKDATSLMKFYDTERTSGRMSPVGKAQQNLFQAQRIQALIDQFKSDPNQMPLTGPASLSEIAIGLNSLLSATGGSEESRKSLIPSSARGKASTIEQFFANEPTGAEMGEFVKNAQDTLAREMKTNSKQVADYKNRVNAATGGGRLARTNPERYKAITDAFLTAPQDAAPQPPKVGEVQDGHKYLGGDPSKASSWGEVK